MKTGSSICVHILLQLKIQSHWFGLQYFHSTGSILLHKYEMIGSNINMNMPVKH